VGMNLLSPYSLDVTLIISFSFTLFHDVFLTSWWLSWWCWWCWQQPHLPIYQHFCSCFLYKPRTFACYATVDNIDQSFDQWTWNRNMDYLSSLRNPNSCLPNQM
jgi:hypothetical protein